jgi:hypothetical protein
MSLEKERLSSTSRRFTFSLVPTINETIAVAPKIMGIIIDLKLKSIGMRANETMAEKTTLIANEITSLSNLVKEWFRLKMLKIHKPTRIEEDGTLNNNRKTVPDSD